MKAKKVIWDLFGGLNGSLGLAIGYEDYDIYTIDILPKTKDGRENIVIDLATGTYFDLKEELDKLPKPDIIAASPMCNSFSTASGMKGSGASGWEYVLDENGERTEKIYIRPREHFENSRLKYENAFPKAVLGERAIINTIEIIQEYKPKYWYIENPRGSLIWKYIEGNLGFNKGIKNLAHYLAYDEDYFKKPTIFLSNINLNLKTTKEKAKIEINTRLKGRRIKNKASIKDRSNIPEQLLKDIINKFNEGEENE